MAPRLASPLDIELSLALTVVASSTAPLLLLNEDLMLIAGSKSFCRPFGIGPPSIPGKNLSALGGGRMGGAATLVAFEGDGVRLCRSRGL
jgi:hypothetical protein